MSDILQNSIETAVEMKAGNQDAQSYINDLRADVRSGSPRAISNLQDLVNLIVITYNEATLLQPNMKEFINQFIDKPRDDNGNILYDSTETLYDYLVGKMKRGS